MKLNAKLIDYRFLSHYRYDSGDGDLELFFSNGVTLKLTASLNDTNGNIKLSSPYAEGDLIARLYLGTKQLLSFELTKTYPTLRKNGIFIKKFTSLKYWVYIKSKHVCRKEIVTITK